MLFFSTEIGNYHLSVKSLLTGDQFKTLYYKNSFALLKKYDKNKILSINILDEMLIYTESGEQDNQKFVQKLRNFDLPVLNYEEIYGDGQNFLFYGKNSIFLANESGVLAVLQ